MSNMEDIENLIPLTPSHDQSRLYLNMEHFTDEQSKYLEELAKFSPKKRRVKVVSRDNTSKRQETYIKENFAYLDINDQVEFNDHKSHMQKQKSYSYLLGTGVFLTSMGYYVVKAPLTRGLFKEGIKSLAFGMISAYGFYRYNQNQYLDTLHHYYKEILLVKQSKREMRSSHVALQSNQSS